MIERFILRLQEELDRLERQITHHPAKDYTDYRVLVAQCTVLRSIIFIAKEEASIDYDD